MTPPDLLTVLQVFHTPSSSENAAERFGCSASVLEGLLLQLQARGLVTPAEPGVGICASGCGFCSLKSFCPSSETEAAKEPDIGTGNPRVWRLTTLGEKSVHQLK